MKSHVLTLYICNFTSGPLHVLSPLGKHAKRARAEAMFWLVSVKLEVREERFKDN